MACGGIVLVEPEMGAARPKQSLKLQSNFRMADKSRQNLRGQGRWHCFFQAQTCRV